MAWKFRFFLIYRIGKNIISIENTIKIYPGVGCYSIKWDSFHLQPCSFVKRITVICQKMTCYSTWSWSLFWHFAHNICWHLLLRMWCKTCTCTSHQTKTNMWMKFKNCNQLHIDFFEIKLSSGRCTSYCILFKYRY